MPFYAAMAQYQLETGLPPLGLHRTLADYVIGRFASPCLTCAGARSQHLRREQANCTNCRGFQWRLSPAAIRRSHQIVTAAFPEIRARCTTETTAKRWAARRTAPVTQPIYLGVAPLPATVPPAPFQGALPVCSLTWRRGLRSEFLWTGGRSGPCVLWERLPDLMHQDGTSWSEVFAWTPAGTMDPAGSVLRLLECGWAKGNRAYDWLSKPTRLSLLGGKAFSVTSTGIVSEEQIQWLFLASARVRGLPARSASMMANAKRLRPGIPRHIAAQAFHPLSGHRTASEPADILDRVVPVRGPVISIQEFITRRENMQRNGISDGYAK